MSTLASLPATKRSLNREMVKGSHSINFTSNELSSGIYYYRIEYDGGNYINKLILLK